MLDVLDFITERGGNPEKIRESQRKRFAPVEIVDEIIELWQTHRKTLYAATELNAKINETQKKIGQIKKAKGNADDLLKEKNDIAKQKDDLLKEAAELEITLEQKLRTIGNIIHSSVTVSNTEDDNPTLKEWAPEGVKVEEKREGLLSHHEVLLRIDGYLPDAGVKIVGHRGYFLQQWGVFLNQAIINYGLQFLMEKGYQALQTPFMMNKEVMAKTAQLADFDEQLYKVMDGSDEKYLIATSEQPISALHSGEWLLPQELPRKYAGYSTNFRREAGAHGKDAWGTFRVHQFEKVEQFVLCDPEKSHEMFHQMMGYAEDFYQSLGIPYRVVGIVSGAFNNAASVKQDLEAWFPYQNEYKELVSTSDCTDYQSREMEIRFGTKSKLDTKKKYVHCLNSTLTATSRTMCAILENFQTPEGVNIPEPLRRYLPGAPEFLPFTKELPKEKVVNSKGKADKAAGAKPKVAAAANTAAETVGKVAEKLKDAVV